MLRSLASSALALHVALAAPAWAQTGPAQAGLAQPGTQEIDPRQMTLSEVWLLQDALIWTGHSVRIKDGGWGRFTQDAARAWRRSRALRASETFTREELALLMRQAMALQAAVGWRVARNEATGAWMGYPSRLISPGVAQYPMPGLVKVEYRGSGSPVSMVSWRADLSVDDLRQMLTRLATAADAGKVTYRLDREDRQVLTTDMADGTGRYMRFDRLPGGGWAGYSLFMPLQHPDFQRTVVATSADFSVEPPKGTLTTPAYSGGLPMLGPVIAEVVTGASPPPVVASARPQPPAPYTPPPAYAAPPVTAASSEVQLPPPRTEQAVSSGTAFAVRKDGTFLTNAHVVEGCTRMALADGTRLDVVRADAKRDLALLRAPGLAVTEVVRFRRDPTIDLGEGVSLFGFPYYRLTTTSLNLTTGTVSSLTGFNDDPMHFQITAALQPGNSGGPLLDEAGLGIGIAVARLSDRTIMRETGSVPQTMNYAIRGAVVEGFLLENGVLLDKAPAQGKADLREVAKQMHTAVRPLLCYR